MKKAILYIHGKGGGHWEAEQYKENCMGFDVIGVDYEVDYPWIVEDKIMAAYNNIAKGYDLIYVLANSIGAYFAMHVLQNCKIEKALFISPILNMEKLILTMTSWANVTERELCEKKEIPTSFGETLSWEYLCFVREHPITWKTPTDILYAGQDNLTSREIVDEFVNSHNAGLTIMENGEHWFHTDEQIAFLNCWLREKTMGTGCINADRTYGL